MKARTIIAAASVALTFIALPLQSAMADNSKKEVTVVGEAAIIEGDKKLARKKALKVAYRRAIEQVAGVYISSATTTSNYQLISDKIFSQSSGYVDTYRVLGEREQDGVYEIKIAAMVKKDVMVNDLAGVMAVIANKNFPRVLVMVSEQQLGGKSDSAWWQGEGNFSMDLSTIENVFIDTLKPKGFNFVDRQALQGKVSTKNALSTDLSAENVKEFARGTGADIVIMGNGITTPGGSVMGTELKYAKASISVKALDLDSGEIIATVVSAADGKTQGTAHIDATVASSRVLRLASRNVADKLFFKVLEQWKTEIAGPSKVNLTLKNVQKFGDVRKLESLLGNRVAAVQDVNRRPYRNKTVMFQVQIEGGSEALATALESKVFRSFGIEIEELTSSTLTATVNKK